MLNLRLNAGTRDPVEPTRGAPDGGAEEQQNTDIKRVPLVIGLGALSWVATYFCMLELIEANLGDLPLILKVIIAFSVAMLMLMIIWLLNQMFARRRLPQCAGS